MNLTAATITIYFLGLANFETGPPYRAVVPLATTTPAVGGKTLVTHRTDLVITNWTTMTTADCTALGGREFSPSACAVIGLQHQELELVSSEALAPPTSRFRSIPKLRTLCRLLGGLDSEVPAALKMDIENGTLDACLNGQAWTASLTVDVAAVDNFKLGPAGGKNTVTLPAGANAIIISVPTGTTHAGEEEHFFWHYYMRRDHTRCDTLPPKVSDADGTLACRNLPKLPEDPTGDVKWDYLQTGVGCSVTQYP